MTSPDVSRYATFSHHGDNPDEPAPVTVLVHLTYHRRDPHAVHFTFTPRRDPVPWELARDLLAEGLLHPAGDGDVRIWPCPFRPGMARIRLRSDSGAAWFTASHTMLTDFLTATYQVVPWGTEASAGDLNGGLAALLVEAGRG